MRGADAQVSCLLLRECFRVQFRIPSYSRCLSMTSVPLLTQIHLSSLPSELERGINLIAHDVGVIAHYATDNGFKLNLRPSFWAAGPLLVELIFLSCLAFVLVIPFYHLSARSATSASWCHLTCHSVVIPSLRRYIIVHRLKYHRNVVFGSLQRAGQIL